MDAAGRGTGLERGACHQVTGAFDPTGSEDLRPLCCVVLWLKECHRSETVTTPLLRCSQIPSRPSKLQFASCLGSSRSRQSSRHLTGPAVLLGSVPHSRGFVQVLKVLHILTLSLASETLLGILGAWRHLCPNSWLLTNQLLGQRGTAAGSEWVSEWVVRGRGSHLLASADAVGSDVLKLVLTVVWTAAVGRIQWMACAAPGIPTNCCSPDLLCIRWLRKYRWYYFYMQIL